MVKRRFKYIFLATLIVSLMGIVYFLRPVKTYPISTYFPLNEDDKYTYIHYEGIEKGIVTKTVKNVRQRMGKKKFSFYWQGKYNDRVQTFLLTSQGMLLYMNKHLVGKVPLKVIRKYSPPLLMIPSQLKKNIFLSTIQSIYDYEGNIIDREKIEANISFVGAEDIIVEAGKFRCLHFFIRHNYKDHSGNSKHMHTYDFWIAPGAGVVKEVHTFIPFLYIKYISSEQKTINNRYSGSFVEVLELKKAIVGGKEIGE